MVRVVSPPTDCDLTTCGPVVISEYPETSRLPNVIEYSIASMAIGESGPASKWGTVEIEPLHTTAAYTPYDLTLQMAGKCLNIHRQVCKDMAR